MTKLFLIANYYDVVGWGCGGEGKRDWEREGGRRLTRCGLSSLFRAVRLIRKITSLLLVVLWLPTAQHCVLEAAGLLSAQAEHADHAQCCESVDGVCDAGACNLLEGGDYQPSTAQVIAPVPNFTVCTWVVWVQPFAFLIETDVEACAPWTSFERPPDWSPTWQFVQRAALSPRAPSLVAA